MTSRKATLALVAAMVIAVPTVVVIVAVSGDEAPSTAQPTVAELKSQRQEDLRRQVGALSNLRKDLGLQPVSSGALGETAATHRRFDTAE